ncbi:uncharacterized protein GGS25DRAFT_18572 [Hypoxylon fragiforme]|uniref:uncharacterized protein n=1 Tax=Hypoxylon fragiforme TaxID=63214 RepID=UPI0020C6760F|nr:uncharacterized protein GGS25DRAFT_18572 [Hypoxylon fragiforme]KAI2613818.1 hypothetical protein GGS25DRAFT_18572 [Hypoxylon fragiforme]
MNYRISITMSVFVCLSVCLLRPTYNPNNNNNDDYSNSMQHLMIKYFNKISIHRVLAVTRDLVVYNHYYQVPVTCGVFVCMLFLSSVSYPPFWIANRIR